MAPFETTTTLVSPPREDACDDWDRKPTKEEQEAKRNACLQAAKNDLNAPRREFLFR